MINKNKKKAVQITLDKGPRESRRLFELKDKFRCLFCGGEACKHENPINNKNSVMEGLNCDRITEDLFAAQRPSTVLIKKYNLIKTFREYLIL
jgi:hypothetical protein